MSATIRNAADLSRAQVALIDFGWFHFAVVDKNRCAWLVCEHEDGEMYATCGSEDGWLPALQVVTLHGPLTVLQDLSPKPFGRPAAPVGEPTDKSVLEILGVSEETYAELTKRHNMHATMRYIEQGCRFCVGPIGDER